MLERMIGMTTPFRIEIMTLVDNTNPIPFLVCKTSTSNGSNAKHFLMT